MTDIYGTVQGYKVYHDERGNSYVDDSAAIMVALIRGSEYIDSSYRALFPGEKAGKRAQEREWPRMSTYDSPVWDVDEEQIGENEIPVEAIHATYEAALREQASPGTLQPDANASRRRKRVRVEGAVSVEYADIVATDSDAYALMVPIIDGIIAPILTGGQDGGAISSLAGKGYRI